MRQLAREEGDTVKTIRKGWTESPVGLTLVCSRCDGEFEVEEGDEVAQTTDEGVRFFYVIDQCPTPKCYGVPRVPVPGKP